MFPWLALNFLVILALRRPRLVDYEFKAILGVSLRPNLKSN